MSLFKNSEPKNVEITFTRHGNQCAMVLIFEIFYIIHKAVCINGTII